jgi:toxin ParE1/3/4
MRIVRRDQARADILDIFEHIFADNEDAADRWLDAVDATIDRTIASNPRIGVKRDYGRPALAGFRMIAVRGFENYLVFYRIDGQVIRIVRVLRGARDVPNVLDPPNE